MPSFVYLAIMSVAVFGGLAITAFILIMISEPTKPLFHPISIWPSTRASPKKTSIEFTHFRKLPPEIRLRIWKLFDEEDHKGQSIHVRLQKRSGHLKVRRRRTIKHNTESASAKIPLIMLICVESRLYGRKKYSASFQASFRPYLKADYFDPLVDTLFIHLSASIPNLYFRRILEQYGPKNMLVSKVPLAYRWVHFNKKKDFYMAVRSLDRQDTCDLYGQDPVLNLLAPMGAMNAINHYATGTLPSYGDWQPLG